MVGIEEEQQNSFESLVRVLVDYLTLHPNTVSQPLHWAPENTQVCFSVSHVPYLCKSPDSLDISEGTFLPDVHAYFTSMHGEPEMIYFTVFIGSQHKRFGPDTLIIVQCYVKHFRG